MRRCKWNSALLVVLCLGLVAAGDAGAQQPARSGQPEPQQAQRPNILVIFGDDVGWMNVSSYGGDIMGVQTPNIDRIGREGLRLTSFYAQPSCTAGRAAFITGQLPVRTGLTTVGTPGSPAGLQKEDITLAEILKARGYATAQFGKNHLGDLEEHLPHRHGFDEFWGNLYHLNGNEDLGGSGSSDQSRVPQEVRSARHRLRHGRRSDQGRRSADGQAHGDLRRRGHRQVARLPRTPRPGQEAVLPLAQLDAPACLHPPEGGGAGTVSRGPRGRLRRRA